MSKLVGVGISVAILAYLVDRTQRNDVFADLRDQPKHWGFLFAAWAFSMAAVCTSFVRWYYLVRALDLPFRLRDAFRLGFVGFLFNFVSLGAVGGDLFKAIFIAREQPGRRTESVATVVVDRLIGLYALFVLSSFSVLVTGLIQSPSAEVRTISYATLVCTGLGGIVVLMVLVPGFTSGAVSEWLTGLPRVGPIIGRLILAVRMYRARPSVLIRAGALSLLVHSFSTTGIYLVGRGLPGQVPTFAQHFVIVPLAMISGVLPLPFMGLGAFESVVDFLYQLMGQGLSVKEGLGFVVSLGYRVITITIAAVGAGIWLSSRREVAELLEDAEQVGIGGMAGDDGASAPGTDARSPGSTTSR